MVNMTECNDNNGFPIFRENEVNMIKNSIEDARSHISDIVNSHTTEKLDFEGMVNMLSILFIKRCGRKDEPLYWVSVRAKAMAATVVDIIVNSDPNISSYYHNEIIKKTKFITNKEGRKSFISFDWHRNYFSCQGEYISEIDKYYEEGTLPLGLSLTPNVLGSGKILDKVTGTVVKLSKKHKNKLRQLASVPLSVRKFSSEELFEWMKQSKSFKEQIASTRSKIDLVKKFKLNAKFVSDLGDIDRLYLTYRYQSSGRFQAIFGLQGVGLHTGGKLFYRFANDRTVEWEDRVMARFIVTQLWSKEVKGRALSFKQCQKTYRKEFESILKWLETYEGHDMVKNTYWNDVKTTILEASPGGKTNVPLHLDITASGPGTLALSFKAKKLAAAVNLNGNKVPRDFHGEMMARSPLDDRDLVKEKIQNPWTHGSGFNLPAKNMGVEPSEFKNILSGAYGDEALYPEMIGSFTSSLINDIDQIVFMRRDDGFMSFGKSYYEGAISEIRYPSCDGSIKKIKLYGNEPLHFGNVSNRIINSSKTEDDYGNKISQSSSGAKIRMLFAISAHSVESGGVSYIYDKIKNPLFSVHDDFFSTGRGLFQVLRLKIEHNLYVYDNKPIQKLITDAFNRKGIDIDIDEILPCGDLERHKVANSTAFLQP